MISITVSKVTVTEWNKYAWVVTKNKFNTNLHCKNLNLETFLINR